jgi:hypothetical protein
MLQLSANREYTAVINGQNYRAYLSKDKSLTYAIHVKSPWHILDYLTDVICIYSYIFDRRVTMVTESRRRVCWAFWYLVYLSPMNSTDVHNRNMACILNSNPFSLPLCQATWKQRCSKRSSQANLLKHKAPQTTSNPKTEPDCQKWFINHDYQQCQEFEYIFHLAYLFMTTASEF